VQQQAWCCSSAATQGCGVAVVADALYLAASTMYLWMDTAVMVLAMIVIACLHMIAIAFAE
jgi:hypothetical protein